MDKLWAPWRMDYVAKPKIKGCIFCRIAKARNDKKNYIFIRSQFCFAVLNRFPYNNGHIMVVPYKHTGDLLKLTSPEILDMHKILEKSIRLCDKILSPHGYNIGLNVGEAAGAGIGKHLHLHLVPRWKGDVNFMPITANTKIIPQTLEQFYSLIAQKAGHAKI